MARQSGDQEIHSGPDVKLVGPVGCHSSGVPPRRVAELHIFVQPEFLSDAQLFGAQVGRIALFAVGSGRPSLRRARLEAGAKSGAYARMAWRGWAQVYRSRKPSKGRPSASLRRPTFRRPSDSHPGPSRGKFRPRNPSAVRRRFSAAPRRAAVAPLVNRDYARAVDPLGLLARIKPRPMLGGSTKRSTQLSSADSGLVSNKPPPAWLSRPMRIGPSTATTKCSYTRAETPPLFGPAEHSSISTRGRGRPRRPHSSTTSCSTAPDSSAMWRAWRVG